MYLIVISYLKVFQIVLKVPHLCKTKVSLLKMMKPWWNIMEEFIYIVIVIHSPSSTSAL